MLNLGQILVNQMKRKHLKKQLLKEISSRYNQGKIVFQSFFELNLTNRSGTLKTGELKDVELVYNPSNIDENDLPFKSKKNKKISGEKH